MRIVKEVLHDRFLVLKRKAENSGKTNNETESNKKY